MLLKAHLPESHVTQTVKDKIERIGGANASTPKPASERMSVSDRVAEAILQDIRSGRLVPGQHLLEPELTARLGISRGSLREALKHLSAAGIVNLSRFRGAYIATLDRKAVLDLLDTLEPTRSMPACWMPPRSLDWRRLPAAGATISMNAAAFMVS